MGALHPVLFFSLIYGLSLFLAFFVCRTVYFSLNGEEPAGTAQQTFETKMAAASPSVNVTAFR